MALNNQKLLECIGREYITPTVAAQKLVVERGDLDAVASILMNGMDNTAIRERLVLCFTLESMEGGHTSFRDRVDSIEGKMAAFFDSFATWWFANRDRLRRECSE